MREKSCASIFFYPLWLSGSPDSLSLLWLPSGSCIRSVFLSYAILLRLPLPWNLFLLRHLLPRNCRLSRTLKMASDVHPTAPPAELQSHRRILALGLTERFAGAGAGASVKSTIWWGKKSWASILFYPPWLSGSPGPLSLLWPLSTRADCLLSEKCIAHVGANNPWARKLFLLILLVINHDLWL